MSAPLRLLVATPRYLPDVGGVERHVHEVARRLVTAGVAVTIVTTDRGTRLPARDRVDGIDVRRVRARPARSDYCFAPEVYSVVREGRWDVVHVQSYHTFVAPLALLAAAQRRLPYVVTFHGGGHSSAIRAALRPAQLALLRPLLVRAAGLVAVARFEIELYRRSLRVPPARFTLIPNGVDLPVAAPAAPTDGARIASVGRLERYKGHHRVLAALPHVLERRPGASLRIIGSGPYERELRRLADRLGVSARVEIGEVPARDRAAMASELASAALVVLLSEWETHPIAALEAAFLGRPLLVADGSGLRELAERGLARTVPLACSPRQVADAVLEQLEHPLLPARVDLPTWDDCAEQLLALYRSVGGGHACAC
jgi:glycosyltransferase involved in cell wall biosynthesis